MIETEFASIFFQKITGTIRFLQATGPRNHRVQQ